MSYIRHKARNGKVYAYQCSSYWDPEAKRSRQKTVYLGCVEEAGSIIPPGERRYKKESLILDFGDGFALHQFFGKSSIYAPLGAALTPEAMQAIAPLIFYRIATDSAMRNCAGWMDGNVLSHLYAGIDLSSQKTSKLLAMLGDERLQRDFFSHYLEAGGNAQKSVIIDGTGLPNEINTGFSAWGYADGAIEKQFRLLCVLNAETKRPLFYRYLPGSLPDVVTLEQTIAELDKMGVKNSFALVDAGYYSESNVKLFYERKIDFLTRLPAGGTLYKSLITTEIGDLESTKYKARCGGRGLFAKSIPVDLYGNSGFAYLVLDPARKGKEMNELLLKDTDEEKEIAPLEFNKCGIMILVSSKKIEESEVVSCYYMRQSVEQVFRFCKDDLGLLPIRRHNDATVRGYLFLQFLALIYFIELREKLLDHCTVEQALMALRHLKCKIFEKELLVSEPTKKQKEILARLSLIAPTRWGI